MIVDPVRQWIQHVPLSCAWAENVDDLVPAARQLVGNEISVTAPRDSFRAHDRGQQVGLQKPI